MKRDEQKQYINGYVNYQVRDAVGSLISGIRNFMEDEIQSRVAVEVQRHLDVYFENILDVSLAGNDKL